MPAHLDEEENVTNKKKYLKDGGSDSELSDLEPDADITEKLEVEPDHISPGGVPVFKPTMDEFADFTRYVSTLLRLPSLLLKVE